MNKYQFLSFIAGIFLGLILLISAGKTISRINAFNEVIRFHDSLSPSTFFYPTARQMLQWSMQKVKTDKINVLLGGSSLLYGVGQPQGKTIADRLQDRLGNQFVVINLATKGGSIMGVGMIMAEKLISMGYPVIYVADMEPSIFGRVMGATSTEYFYWDAKYNRLMFDWEPRDKIELWSLENSPDSREKQLNAIFNLNVFFNEFWTFIGYKYIFTVFSNMSADKFWRPRKEFRDSETDPPVKPFFYQFERQIEIVKSMSTFNKNIEMKSLTWNDEVPDYLRKYTITVLCENNPALLQLMSVDEQKSRKILNEFAYQSIKNQGQNPVSPCNDFNAFDYIDRVHLSVSGADKISEILAASINLRVKELLFNNALKLPIAH